MLSITQHPNILKRRGGGARAKINWVAQTKHIQFGILTRGDEPKILIYIYNPHFTKNPPNTTMPVRVSLNNIFLFYELSDKKFMLLR